MKLFQWITIKPVQTVAELPEFIRMADKLLSIVERQDLIRYLASHLRAGDPMEGTGGVRKLRWRRGDHGKSGGVRVIYYFHDEYMPLYLLTLFAKGDRANLSKGERNELAGLTRTLVGIWKAKGLKK
ncbi:MAG: RelE-like translational repressor toxin [Burkholderiaceae bacterium]|nr:MAG: RelE-like translational repressor toxin [Burkholderiaceae bacterium]